LWTEKGKEFYNRNVDEILKQHGIKLYSTENEEKSSVVECWNRMWQKFSELSSSYFLDILTEIVKKYNNNYHNSIKMTPIQASRKENDSIVYFNLFDIKQINKKAKLKIGNTIRISKYKI